MKATDLIYVIEEFRHLDSEMPAQTMLTFLHVLQKPDIMLVELAEKMGVSNAAVSRNLSKLARWQKMGKPGLDLVERVENPANRREKNVSITKKGERFAQRLEKLLT